MPIGIVGVDFYVFADENNIDFDPLISIFYITKAE